MSIESNAQGPPKHLVFWILWFSILSGLLMILFIAGGGIPSGPDRVPAPLGTVAIASGAAFLSLAVRFLVLPSLKTLAAKLPAMLVGLAFGEGCGILAIFVIPTHSPQTKLWLLAASFIALILHAPVYAKDPAMTDGYQK